MTATALRYVSEVAYWVPTGLGSVHGKGRWS